jgi:alpha-tubulin suppressor-like RCC1 family protein
MTGIMQMLLGAIKASVPQFLYTWGFNTARGRIGDNTTINRSSPVQIGSDDWSKVSTNDNSTFIINADTQSLYGMGANSNGRLGKNDTIDYSSPVIISTADWLEVAASPIHTLAIRTNGTLWAWGSAGGGCLGNNTSSPPRSSPIQVGALSTWSKVYAGNYTSLGLRTDGTLWAWGSNGFGQLGRNNRVDFSSPVQVLGGQTWVSAGITENWSGGTDSLGRLWTWGSGRFGQLGINISIANRSVATQVGSLTDWAYFSNGRLSGQAIKTNGTMWAWGLGTYGQNATNDAVFRSSPIQVGALTTWAKVSQGGYAGGAIKTDGTLWTWGGKHGSNNYGAAGNDSTINVSSPIQIGTETTWIDISCSNADQTASAAITGTPS